MAHLQPVQPGTAAGSEDRELCACRPGSRLLIHSLCVRRRQAEVSRANPRPNLLSSNPPSATHTIALDELLFLSCLLSLQLCNGDKDTLPISRDPYLIALERYIALRVILHK